MVNERTVTDEGYETNFATNTLGNIHFSLESDNSFGCSCTDT